MSQFASVRVVGMGSNQLVTLEDGTPVGVILEEAGLGDSGLEVKVNGEVVEPDFVPEDGTTVIVVPRNVKLG